MEKATEPRPGMLDSLYDEARRQAYVMYQAERFQETEVLLKGILSANPRDAWALSVYAGMLRQQRRLKEALVLLETAHAIDPSNKNVAAMRDELVNFAKAVQQIKETGHTP